MWGRHGWGVVTAAAIVGACQHPPPAPARSSIPPPALSVAVPEAGPQTRTAPIPNVRGTPGRIQCGTSACDLQTEICCATEDGAEGDCVPRDGFQACPDERIAHLCDETADCKAGSVCCETWGCTGGCPMMVDCERGGCAFDPDGEVCIDQSTCSQPRTCDAKSGAGHCRVPPRPIQCAGKPCHQTCCWDSESRVAECRANCPTEDLERHLAFGCTSPQDCPGGACANLSPGPVLGCLGVDLASDRASWILCDTVADCPHHWGVAPTGCAEHEMLPPGVQACLWSEDP